MNLEEAKLFAKFQNKKIALYGLGTETERVLENLDDKDTITGLLDSYREEGRLYGKPIISLYDAVQTGVQLIIVVARPGSCRAITRKIGATCREHDIALMDIRGKDLLAENRISYEFTNICGVTKSELKEKIQNFDIISFDLFDTLVMRKTLFSDDVADYVNCRLQEKGIYIEDFAKKRLESEKRLSKNTAPTLVEIYENMLDKMDSSISDDVTAEKLASLEWTIDFDLLTPRKDVCSIFKDAVDNGKRVYILSDTYYNKTQLSRILKKCGITKCTDIISSSDYKTGKIQELYGVLKKKEQAKRYLHIGDDIVADVESAHRWGFETCRLFSGIDLLDSVGNLGLTDHMITLSERLKVGMFVSRIFNSPFQFENADRRIRISDAYDIGYLLCAPVISDFVFWFYHQTTEYPFQNIWFSARDGYLIKKMYSYIQRLQNRKDESVYFMTSRTAAIRAGVRNEDDIRYVDDMKFSGSLEENLKQRFGIYVDELDETNIDERENGLMRYKKPIIRKAEEAYKNYKMYLNQLHIMAGDIAFFDFVAKGTSQMYIQRLVDNHIKGFYFYQLEAEYMKDKGLDICSFYANGKEESCAIFDDYYIIETLLTAPHPSVCGFDENGKPVYAIETRQADDIRCLEKAQEGIMDYFRTYIELCPESERLENRKLDEIILKLVHGISITDTHFLNLIVEDPFFNRMTNVVDVI